MTKILFMCVANSARSQLAEGLARQVFPAAEIHSAGSHPGKLNPFAVEVMKEIAIDISHHFSKSVDQLPIEFIKSLDYVITLCAEEVCPVVISNAVRIHWPHPDPASSTPLENTPPITPLPNSEMLSRFRAARDAIHEKLLKFKAEISK